MANDTDVRCTQRSRSISNKSIVRRHSLIRRSQLRRYSRRSLDETRKIEINKKTQNESNVKVKHVKRRNSLPDMPNISEDEEVINAPAAEKRSDVMPDHELKQEKNPEQPTVPTSTNEQKNEIAELNKQSFSSNDLQTLNDQNRELNNVSAPRVVYSFKVNDFIR